MKKVKKKSEQREAPFGFYYVNKRLKLKPNPSYQEYRRVERREREKVTIIIIATVFFFSNFFRQNGDIEVNKTK